MIPADQRDLHRRLYGPVLLVGVLAAVGIAVGSSHAWAAASSSAPGLPALHATVSGADLAPLAGALGYVVLAGFGAVVATRGWVRRAVGLLIAVASVAVLVEVLVPGSSTAALRAGLSAKGWAGGPYAAATQPWRWLVLACSVVTAAAGALTVRYGGRWAVMGARYDAVPAARVATAKPPEELTETEVWQALDQGRDPTREV